MCKTCDDTGVVIRDLGYGYYLQPCICKAWEKRKETRDRDLDDVLESLNEETIR